MFCLLRSINSRQYTCDLNVIRGKSILAVNLVTRVDFVFLESYDDQEAQGVWHHTIHHISFDLSHSFTRHDETASYLRVLVEACFLHHPS